MGQSLSCRGDDVDVETTPPYRATESPPNSGVTVHEQHATRCFSRVKHWQRSTAYNAPRGLEIIPSVVSALCSVELSARTALLVAGLCDAGRDRQDG
jgi:hypothetical protein